MLIKQSPSFYNTSKHCSYFVMLMQRKKKSQILDLKHQHLEGDHNQMEVINNGLLSFPDPLRGS